MKKAKLSIIIILYNTPKEYLERSIESVLNQTIKDIDIVLVNDGSKEEIANICKKYEKQDSRITLINQKNQGESVARNVGIQNAKTDYIMFIDSDDFLEKNACEKVLKYMKKIKYDFDMIFFDCFVDYPNKRIENKFYNKIGKLNKNDIEELQLQNIDKGISKYYPPESNISVVWAKVYNKRFLLKENLKFIPGIIRMPDALFNMEVLEKIKKIYYYPQYLYHYRKNPSSICEKFSNDTIKYYETYIKFLEEYIMKYDKNYKFKEMLNIKRVTCIDRYMYNYFFHKDNPKNWEDIKREFINLLEEEKYKEALKNVNTKYLSIYQKVIVKASIKANIRLLKIIYICKKAIRKVFI